jgi:hypothetical protein
VLCVPEAQYVAGVLKQYVLKAARWLPPSLIWNLSLDKFR